MRHTFQIFNGELFHEMFEFFGEPLPCKECLVRATCFSWIGAEGCIYFELENICKEAKKWFQDFKSLDHDIFSIIKKFDYNDEKLSAEDIIKIIDNWEDNPEKLKNEIRLSISSIDRIGKYINELDPKYCHPRKSFGGVLVLNKIINEALDILKKREIS